MVSVNLKARF